MVPVGGFEVKVKQVSLQPASDVPNSVDAQNRSTQTPGRRDRAFSAKICAIGHRQTGEPSYKEIFYAEAEGRLFFFEYDRDNKSSDQKPNPSFAICRTLTAPVPRPAVPKIPGAHCFDLWKTCDAFCLQRHVDSA
jgi:hypothetical protein